MRTLLALIIIQITLYVMSASVTITSVPESIEKNRIQVIEFSVSDITTDRYFVILDIYDSQTNNRIERFVDDNVRSGYQVQNGTFSIKYRVSKTVASVYFNAYLVPLQSMNHYMLDKIQTYPTDGTYSYYSGGNGYTHDIYYDNRRIANDDVNGNACHDKGITFEVFAESMLTFLANSGQERFHQFSGSRMEEVGLGYGETISGYGIGYELTDPTNLQAGDYVRVKRNDEKYYHGIINETIIEGEQLIGIKYWSSQPETNGIGYKTEYFGDEGSLYLNESYFARILKPFEPSDLSLLICETNTQNSPITVIDGYNLLEDFEFRPHGEACMFQSPSFSGSTIGLKFTRAPKVYSLSSEPYWDYSNDNSLSLFCQWDALNASEFFARMTTYNAEIRPNPTLDLTKGLSFYILNSRGEPINLSLWIRETGVDVPIGEDGGTSGTIEQLKNFKIIPNSEHWQYVYFDIPNEEYEAISGNGILDGQKGTLESLIFTPYFTDYMHRPYVIFNLDDFSQGDKHISSCSVAVKDILSQTELQNCTVTLYDIQSNVVAVKDTAPALFSGVSPGMYYLICEADNYDTTRYPALDWTYFEISEAAEKTHQVEIPLHTFSACYWLYE